MMMAKTAVLVTILIAFCAPALQKPSADKVLIGFYSEALCPDCMDFACGALNEAFKKVCIKSNLLRVHKVVDTVIT